MLTCIECNITQEGSAIHHTSDGYDLCGVCAYVKYTECCDCFDLIHRERVEHKYKSGVLCDTCRKSDYTECADCSEILHIGSDDCFDNDSEEAICECCHESYCYDELNDCTIHMDNAVSATNILRGGQCDIITHTDNATCINGDYYTEYAADELFTRCEGCGDYVDREYALYTDYYSYCEGCYPSDDDINYQGMGDDIDGTTFNDCISHRRYGIEIECVDAGGSSYSNDTSFQSKSDSSLDSGGCEFVSPILQGDDGFKELRKMCRTLSSNHASVNGSCGLHIHIDLSDFNETELARLFYFIQRLEPIVRKFVPSGRNRNTYCEYTLEKKEFSNNFRDGYFTGLQRYSAYNFISYNCNKTLEIRLHQGTIDYTEIRNWLSLHLAVVDYVKRRQNSNEAEIKKLLPIIADDVSAFYDAKREQYYPMTLEERAVESAREMQETQETLSDRMERERLERLETLAANRRSMLVFAAQLDNG